MPTEDDPITPFAYTIGMYNDGSPELIVMGQDYQTCGYILNTVAAAIRDGRLDPISGNELLGVLGVNAEMGIRLGEVCDEQAEKHGIQAFEYHQTLDVPFLQVVLPDLEGRWPDDPEVSQTFLKCQLDLSQP